MRRVREMSGLGKGMPIRKNREQRSRLGEGNEEDQFPFGQLSVRLTWDMRVKAVRPTDIRKGKPLHLIEIYIYSPFQ